MDVYPQIIIDIKNQLAYGRISKFYYGYQRINFRYQQILLTSRIVWQNIKKYGLPYSRHMRRLTVIRGSIMDIRNWISDKKNWNWLNDATWLLTTTRAVISRAVLSQLQG